MRIDESENSTLQVRSEYFSGLKGKHAHGDGDEKPAKKTNAKKDKPEEANDQAPVTKKGGKAKKAKAKKAAKAAQAGETSSEAESAEDMDDSDHNHHNQQHNHNHQNPTTTPKEITAADRKKAKKQREKDSKRDPADLMDPHNIKPVRAAGADEDLKAQIAKFEFKCSACPFGTDTNEEFKSHFKSEWHKINLKRKVAEQDPLTEEQFKELVILKEFA